MVWIYRLCCMRNQTKSDCSCLHQYFYSLFQMKEWMIVHGLYFHLLIVNHLSQGIKTHSFFFNETQYINWYLYFRILMQSILLDTCKCLFLFPSTLLDRANQAFFVSLYPGIHTTDAANSRCVAFSPLSISTTAIFFKLMVKGNLWVDICTAH